MLDVVLRYLILVKRPMADVFTRAERSAVMAKIRGRDNRATDLRLASLFRHFRITGWRRHVKVVAGARARGRNSSGKLRTRVTRPDFVFAAWRVVVFVDGCFWHSCPKHSTMPQSNRVFWKLKLDNNKQRDLTVTRSLRLAGWIVVRIWEHDLTERPEWCVRKIKRALG